MSKKFNQDDYIYYSLLVTIIILVLIGIVVMNYVKIPECIIYKNLHIYCPGCGCTRAFIAMLNGNFLESIYQNSTVLYTTIITLSYLISQTISRITKIDKIAIKYNSLFLYSGIGMLAFNWILKNICLLVFKM